MLYSVIYVEEHIDLKLCAKKKLKDSRRLRNVVRNVIFAHVIIECNGILQAVRACSKILRSFMKHLII